MRKALEKDGWTVTHNPLRLRYGCRELLLDLGAERDERKIAVLVEEFEGVSEWDGLVKAVREIKPKLVGRSPQ